MDVIEAIGYRRSIKNFADRPVPRETLERLLHAAVQAPNHHMTEPWRFFVLGPETRRAYGRVLGERKAAKVEDPAAGAMIVEKQEAEHAALPAMIAVATTVADEEQTRAEDYAATFMAIENLLLAAVDEGLGTHLKTGAVLDDPRTREALGVPEGERLVAVVRLGEPEGESRIKPRQDAAAFTRWLP